MVPKDYYVVPKTANKPQNTLYKHIDNPGRHQRMGESECVYWMYVGKESGLTFENLLIN